MPANAAPCGPDYSGDSNYPVFNDSCAMPLSSNGNGDITSAPQFVDSARLALMAHGMLLLAPGITPVNNHESLEI